MGVESSVCVYVVYIYIFKDFPNLQSKIRNQRICVSFPCIFAFYPTINPHEPHLFKYELSKRQQQAHTCDDKEVMKIVFSVCLTLSLRLYARIFLRDIHS